MNGRKAENGLSDGGGDGEGSDGYDAVVVGSGYGGSVAACRMSMAGIKVCLIEKGRRWEASDFPTNSAQVMSEVRVVSNSKVASFGRKDALFQVNFKQSTSMCVRVCIYIHIYILAFLLLLSCVCILT